MAGLAIDIAYMYNVKNQLQVAADASALAGAKRLVAAQDSDTSVLAQDYARQEAWKYACKNTAAGSNVYVVTKTGNCDNPPANLNQTNAPNGDIVVGNWTQANGFRAANGGTGLRINAIKVVAKRTSGSPGGTVKVFWGNVLSLLFSPGSGPNWSRMAAASQAIAVAEEPGKGALPICSLDCGKHTPLVPSGDNLTPGVRFFLQCPHASGPYMGWTTFYDNNSSNSNIAKYILGEKEPPTDMCTPANSLYTTEGVTNSACQVRERIRASGADYNVNGHVIHGWEVLIPILEQGVGGCGSGGHCISDPGIQPYPYPVQQYSLAIVTDALSGGNCSGDPGPYATGDPGVVVVGTGPGGTEADGTPYSTIQCLACDDPTFAPSAAMVKLVK